jgi:formate--tetrahydrofolate ligase
VTAIDAARFLDLPGDQIIPFGRGVAKLDGEPRPRRGRLVLVSAMTPTAQGEGKTTTSIGLADGLRALGEHAVVALRQPSLGPLFGAKGGGSGGGKSRLSPSERVDLHLTGDLHAIAAAHNLLAAAIDNHLHFHSDLKLDPRHVRWPRVVDMNDRTLRHIVVGLGHGGGGAREAGFVVTAASEVTAVMGLATDRDDLRARLSRIIVGTRRDKTAVTAGDIGVVGAMMAILVDAWLPNLVSTLEGTPAFVHGGPFANIAHGCSSVHATRTALGLADWVVTEAGFGFDLGGEKFFDIKCRAADLDADVVVLVVTARSLTAHGDGELGRGLGNLAAHVASVRAFGKEPVVAINRRSDDAPEAVATIEGFGSELGVVVVPSDHFSQGGAGATALARAVVASARNTAPVRRPYELTDEPRAKLHAVATRIYGAREVVWTPEASKQLDEAVALGAGTLPVCVAKTQWSLSDDARRLGRPSGFDLTVRGVKLSAGAGFWVALAGDIALMPGLPRHPRAEHIDVGPHGFIGIGE